MSDEEKASGPGDARRELEEQILKDAPRLGPDDKFKFACHPGVSCFNNLGIGRCHHQMNDTQFGF